MLIERGEVASGASGSNAGFLLQGSATDYFTDTERIGRAGARTLWKATLQNRLLVEELFGRDRIGFVATGSCRAAGDVHEASRLERSAALLAEDGMQAEYIDSDTVNRLLSSSRFEAGLVVPAGAVVDPVMLAQRLAEASGATIVDHAPVRSVTFEPREGIELLTPRLLVRTERAILTLNAYLPLLLPELAAVVHPVRAQMMSTAAQPPFLRMPVYSHDGYYYARQLSDGRLVAGGARHLHRRQEVGYSLETTEALQRDLDSYVSTYFPAGAAAPVERRWAGTMGFSPDGLPMWGRAKDMHDLLWIGGFTGHGLSLALVVGKMVAEIVAGTPDSVLAALFDAERLGNQGTASGSPSSDD